MFVVVVGIVGVVVGGGVVGVVVGGGLFGFVGGKVSVKHFFVVHPTSNMCMGRCYSSSSRC